MTKVVTIVGTRPEIIKLSRVIAELKKHVNHILVHTGQNYDYELNDIFFNDLGVEKPDYFLNAVGDSTAQTIGNIISEADKILEKENPDAVLILETLIHVFQLFQLKEDKYQSFIWRQAIVALIKEFLRS